MIDVGEPSAAGEGDPFEARTVEVEDVEPEVLESDLEDGELPSEFEQVDDVDVTPRKPGWRRFARLIVPIAIALYLLVSALVRNN